MPDPLSLWRNFLARPNEDPAKVFGVAFLVALISAVLVSVTSVTLKPLQEAHLEAERAARMAAMLDRLPGMRDVMADLKVDALETRLVDLATGTFVSDVDPATFDPIAAAADPEESVEIPTDADVARLGRRANLAQVHLLERDGELLLIVLPVSGKGYQSTLRAMLALNADLTTISALTITEQGDTPGIGARVEDPDWLSLWPGKEIADADGRIVITVVRGAASGAHEVDAISGATITSNGVSNMLQYWLGDHGFGPFLARLRAEGL
ncbi:MAG: NADH:ubiquinone reductase (Na(+)-transporting) subunit C [Silicimonas sp.]|nr:NADH:ubiquinone reductase (Na(+)-transporting) subunit C [Silicimonas sp.]